MQPQFKKAGSEMSLDAQDLLDDLQLDADETKVRVCVAGACGFAFGGRPVNWSMQQARSKES